MAQQTPASGSAPYASVTQLTNRRDWRTLAQLLSDTDTPLTLSQLQESEALLDLMQEASGLIEAACLVGARYRILPANGSTPAINDLLAIQNAETNSSAMLAGLVAMLTMYLAWVRRPARFAKAAMPADTELAFERLDKLEKGELLFGTVENQQSGIVNIYQEGPREYDDRRLSVRVAAPFFGRRAQQWPAPLDNG